jgi:hypothetical protein
MPRISEFYGIAIYMYYSDHSPPHFHAIYAAWEAEVEIASGDLLEGRLPPAARRLLRIWAKRHRAELLDNWQRARLGLPVARIAPLE